MGTVGDQQIQVTCRLSGVTVRRITPAGEEESLSLNFAEINTIYSRGLRSAAARELTLDPL